jgi:transcriptional regulator with XRE-family HTH domain
MKKSAKKTTALTQDDMKKILLKYTAQEVAEKTGVHFNTVRNFRRGVGGCNMATFEKLRAFCDGVAGSAV